MRLTCCRSLRIASVVVSCMAGVASPSAGQPPTPAVQVQQMPTLRRMLLPGDFNGDGRQDLVAGHAETPSATTGAIVIRFGTRGGAFSLPRATGASGTPVAVGDFNGDRRLDIAAIAETGHLGILPGRGDGTFERLRPLGSFPDFRFGLAAELNGDNRLDLVVGHGVTVEVHPGLGDFTFGPAMTLPPGNEHGSISAAVADFDRNGLDDLAVAQAERSVFLYHNRGGLLFGVTEIFIGDFQGMKGLAAGDVNDDGRADLVVPHSQLLIGENWDSGAVEVLLGNGNGTFADRAQYSGGLRGQLTAAIGDFNRDGVTDLALGGRSALFEDELTFGDHALVFWDSVTILPGLGDGTFAFAAAFRLDTSNTGTERDFVYVGSHSALRTADMDGDGHLDLIATPGAVVFNRPPSSNRPPTINAGPDIPAPDNEIVILAPVITEPDWDWLSFEWRDGTGRVISQSPRLILHSVTTQTYTVTVIDWRGASASDSITVTRVPAATQPLEVIRPAGGQHFPSGADIPIEWRIGNLGDMRYRISASADDFRTSRFIADNVFTPRVVWENAGPASANWRVKVEAFDGFDELVASATSAPFVIDSPGSAAPPWPWRNRDIGLVGAAGSATFADGRFTVRGAGSDIWGTADEFHFVYQRVDGDVVLEGRVLSIAGTQPWTKAGLMIRQSLSAGSVHHFALASLSRGLAHQRRTTTGGASLHTTLGPDGAGATFRITRTGGLVRIQVKRDGEATFATVAVQAFPAGPAYVGLAVTSHEWSRLAIGTFDGLQVRTATPGLPSGWSSGDVGAVGAPGRASYFIPNDIFTVEGSGADIWGTADEFHFVSRAIVDEGGGLEITARVASVQNVNRWTKVGLMVRAHRGAGAAHASVFVTPTTERGVAFQRRRSDGAASIHTAGPAITAPIWLKLIAQNGTVRAYYRQAESDPWTFLGEDRVTLPTPYEAGLVVSSHVDGTIARATFDAVTAASRPLFESRDIGAVGVSGTTTANDITRTLEGSGADIWGTADAFRYHFAPLSPAGTIAAAVRSVEPTHHWAKAGVMMRASLSPGSPHVMLIASAERGIAMQYRATAGGQSANITIVTGRAPVWVRLVRDGQIVRGEVSEDGVFWDHIGLIELDLGASPTAGLAVTSHANATLATAVFTDVLLLP